MMNKLQPHIFHTAKVDWGVRYVYTGKNIRLYRIQYSLQFQTSPGCLETYSLRIGVGGATVWKKLDIASEDKYSLIQVMNAIDSVLWCKLATCELCNCYWQLSVAEFIGSVKHPIIKTATATLAISKLYFPLLTFSVCVKISHLFKLAQAKFYISF